AVTNRHSVASVHHAQFPVANEQQIDSSLEYRMQLAQDVCSLVLSIRKNIVLANGQRGIKVRQPLHKILIPVLDASMQQQLVQVEHLILAEVNVKEISYLQPTDTFIKKKAKANFKTLGSRLGGKMKAVANAVAAFNQQDITKIETEGKYVLEIEGETITLAKLDVEITADDIEGWSVASNDKVTVALDVTITPELLQEGIARELVNRIQNIRKDSGFELTDTISVSIQENPLLQPAIQAYENYVCQEILAEKIHWLTQIETGTTVEINDSSLVISIEKKV
ncbi:MAG: isoleucine--tRNA ligase, partial [Bacteroidetes bacterium]